MQAIKDAARKVGTAALSAAKTPWIVFATLTLAIFLISAISFLASPFRGTANVLFYPNAKGRILDAELRYIPDIAGDEETARLLVEELLIGTRDTRHLPLVNPETRSLAVILRNGSLYVDLSMDVINYREVPFSTVEEGIRRTILFNLPFVRDVFVTIEGQIPVLAVKSSSAVAVPAAEPAKKP